MQDPDLSIPAQAVELLRGTAAALQSFSLPTGLESATVAKPGLVRLLQHLARRLSEGARAPLRLALFGPTGAGKSKVFNSLLGEVVSPAGYRRPFTMRPVYSVPAAHWHLSSTFDGEVRQRSGARLEGIVLVDTPDFDSVESRNRDEAERIFREVDAFLFVTDVQKYADQSTWEYLRRMAAEGKPAILVLNKTSSEGPCRDFRARLGKELGDLEVITLEDRPIDDTTLLPADLPGLVRIESKIRELLGTGEERLQAKEAAFRADLRHLAEGWGRLERQLGELLAGIDALRTRLLERLETSCATLGDEINAPIDEGVKTEVATRVLEGIQRIDLLRYPRRLLALPIEGVRQLVGRFWPARPEKARSDPAEVGRTSDFQVLEARVLALADQAAAEMRSEARCPGLFHGVETSALRVPHEELTRLHNERHERFRAWLDREARETASRLTSEHKVKFFLSQLIYNSVVVGIQIHTAGHFTLLEAATDGVLSPLVAKAIGHALSHEQVTRFERSARVEHVRLLGEVLRAAQQPWLKLLEDRSSWQADFLTLRERLALVIRGGEDLGRLYSSSSERSAAEGTS